MKAERRARQEQQNKGARRSMVTNAAGRMQLNENNTTNAAQRRIQNESKKEARQMQLKSTKEGTTNAAQVNESSTRRVGRRM
jgi:hypothetical protein